MKMIIKKNTLAILAAIVIGSPLAVSCVDEPDASNLYNSLELTIEQRLESDEDLSAFNGILLKT